MVTISGVEQGSLAQRKGIVAGDKLISINGHAIVDVLDYRFYETEALLRICLDRDGEKISLEIKKSQYSRLGLEFDTYLMDEQQSCKNKCVFCFIDQMPPGMRETLYFKDDDHRLSFLFGNYITLTNIQGRDIERIIQMHISPINISVHTMNPQLRCKMMNNRFAGESLRHLYRLAEGGIELNCQIVLCPGLNDGEALEYSLSELCKLGSSLKSVACVPVGLTRFRDGLYPLKPFDAEKARAALETIERWGEECKAQRGNRVVFASDEMYLIAGWPLPPLEYYEDFPQIENGVGMLRDLEDGFLWALKENRLAVKRKVVTIPTGEGAFSFINYMLDSFRKRYPQIVINLLPIINNFFGGTVNVTGLLTGQDIYSQLMGKDLGDELLISNNMLKSGEDIFLDDMSLTELSDKLNVPVRRVGSSGEDLLLALLGVEQRENRQFSIYEDAGK